MVILEDGKIYVTISSQNTLTYHSGRSSSELYLCFCGSSYPGGGTLKPLSNASMLFSLTGVVRWQPAMLFTSAQLQTSCKLVAVLQFFFSFPFKSLNALQSPWAHKALCHSQEQGCGSLPPSQESPNSSSGWLQREEIEENVTVNTKAMSLPFINTTANAVAGWKWCSSWLNLN